MQFLAKIMPKKNAFQWDSYRPLVDHIPACSGGVYLIGVCPGESLPHGVSARGVSAQGVSAQGVSAQGGMSTWVGVCPGGGRVCHTHFPWTDRHVWKRNLRKLRLLAVIIGFRSKIRGGRSPSETSWTRHCLCIGLWVKYDQKSNIEKFRDKQLKIKIFITITYMSHFAYACKIEGENGISRLISETA